MQISSRFTIALHTLVFIGVFHDRYKITGDFLAESIQSNPVIIRNILSQLKEAGLINVTRGTGGAALAKEQKDITLLDVYQAVDAIDGDALFRFHAHPNPDCPVGGNIHRLLDDILEDAQAALENELKRYTLADLHDALMDILENKKGADA